MKGNFKNFSLIIVSLAALFILTSCIKKDSMAVKAGDIEEADEGSALQWIDPPGDTETEQGDQPLPDIVLVAAEAKEGSIHLTVKLNGGLSSVLDWVDEDGDKTGAILITFYIDTDNNEATGVSSDLFSKREHPDFAIVGYECKITVLAGYRYIEKDSGYKNYIIGTAVLDPSKVEITGYLASSELRLIDDKGFFSVGVNKPDGSWLTVGELTELTDNGVLIRIPYELLQLKAGDTVRILYKDNEGPFSKYSKEKKLVLAH